MVRLEVATAGMTEAVELDEKLGPLSPNAAPRMRMRDRRIDTPEVINGELPATTGVARSMLGVGSPWERLGSLPPSTNPQESNYCREVICKWLVEKELRRVTLRL